MYITSFLSLLSCMLFGHMYMHTHTRIHTYTHTHTLTVRPCMDGSIRLADGVGNETGRVEVCVGGIWGTICDRFFNNADANFVCGLIFNTTTSKF